MDLKNEYTELKRIAFMKSLEALLAYEDLYNHNHYDETKLTLDIYPFKLEIQFYDTL